jgi:hypothetical protein
MSLDWNATKAEKWHEIDEPWQTAIIWATMGVGMGTITEKNWREFVVRWIAIERAGGWGNQAAENPRQVAEVVHNAIGLTTNVSKESNAKFAGKLLGSVERSTRAALVEVGGPEAKPAAKTVAKKIRKEVRS